MHNLRNPNVILVLSVIVFRTITKLTNQTLQVLHAALKLKQTKKSTLVLIVQPATDTSPVRVHYKK